MGPGSAEQREERCTASGTREILRRIPLAHAVDQRVFPISEAAERQRRRDGSTLVSDSASTPSALMSTKNSEISVSRPLDPVRAATIAKSAIAPSGTGFFTPLRLLPEAESLIACGDGLPLPSNNASVPIASPDAISGSHFCFCASLPASRSASAAR